MENNTTIYRISDCTFPTPLTYAGCDSSAAIRYRVDSDRVLLNTCFNSEEGTEPSESFERAGPREMIMGNPAGMTAAIMTCGGLCPGLNDVIRGLVMSLNHHYGVKKILGIRYGYAGLAPGGLEPLELCPESIEGIHRDGGSMLGVGRGKQDVDVMAQRLDELGVNILFVIGGDGTQRGALELSEKCREIGAPISLIGIPKTIDNDILWVDQSFGFDTAVNIAAQVVQDAHVEAHSAQRCIGLVKVMGRNSGFIAAHAALASLEANAVLVPEVPFSLEHAGGILDYLEKRIREKDHAVLVVAEGAGQELMPSTKTVLDASGNSVHQDIGLFLCDRIKKHFSSMGLPISMKYFDPSYSVRSAPADSRDRVYCTRLAHAAVHAAMAGKTGMMVSRWAGRFVHVPLDMVTQGQRKIDPTGSLWRTVLEATGQPCLSECLRPDQVGE